MFKTSELKVIHCYYIGRTQNKIPYSRESGYYNTYKEAEKALETGFEVQQCVENNSAYDSSNLPNIRIPIPKNNRLIRIGKKYEYLFQLIQAAIATGFKMSAGYNGFYCRNCGNNFMVQKFLRNRGTVYACTCGGRWGSLINKTNKLEF